MENQKLKKAFTIVLLFFVLHAQAQTIDSLYAVYRASSGAARIVAANEIFAYAYEMSVSDSLFYVKPADEREYIDASVIEVVGAYYEFVASNYPKSIEWLKQAIDIYEKLGRHRSVNKLNGTIGTNYARLGDHENAVAYMMKNYEWETNAGDNEGLSSTLNNLGVVYTQWGKRDLAIQFFEEAVKVERPLNRPLQYASRLAQLARGYSYIDAEKALPLIKEALLQNEKIEQQRLREERIAVHTSIMGDIYIELDSLKNAEHCYRQSLVFFENNGRTYNVASTLLALGRLHLREGRLNEAIASLKNCEEMAEQNGFLPFYRDACRSLSDAYHRLKSNDLAFSYLNKYTVINDSIFKETTQRQINDFQVRYETAEKQLEIERQQSEIDRQKSRQYLYLGGLVAASLLLALLIYIVSLRNRRNRALAERNDALSIMNATKDKFFSIVSHDLNNPAVAQRDALQTLVNHIRSWDTDTLSEYVNELLQSAEGHVGLIYNLLGWARLQTGRMTYEPKPFYLAARLRADILLVRNIAAKKGVTLIDHIPDEALVVGDSNMLSTVVRNLLTNAVKFTSAGGQVSFTVESTTGGYAVSVSDTGTGMNSEQLQKLFRLDNAHSHTGTSGEQGSGLGLIVCKEMLEKHGSRLCIESEEGKGSRFWFGLNRPNPRTPN
ncbi:MAG: tetratricopeptide repeat protein [Bacteroidales bacterium]|nr:tetratricopeptide repeat protein [Bacteroidales bacterium]